MAPGSSGYSGYPPLSPRPLSPTSALSSTSLRPPLPTYPRRHHDRCGRRIKLWIYLHDLRMNERPTIIATGTHNTIYYSMEAGKLGFMSRFSERQVLTLNFIKILLSSNVTSVVTSFFCLRVICRILFLINSSTPNCRPINPGGSRSGMRLHRW